MMKRITMLGISLLLLGQAAYADSTFVSGAVRGNWTREGSPYIIENYLIIETGDTLSIGPGVRVYFTGPYFLQMDSASVLRAVGAEGDSVVFTTDTLANPEGWRGILNSYANEISLEYCVVENGRTEEYHLIIVNSTAHAVQHCAFRDNGYVAGNWTEGAVIGFWRGEGRVSNCLFERNRGTNGGCIGWYEGSSTIIENCDFRNNSAQRGGAIAISWSVGTVVRNCVFENNVAEGGAYSHGGAIWLEGTGIIEDCRFIDNRSERYGGAISCLPGGFDRISHCEFVNNHTDSLGGAIYASFSANEIEYCLFDGNSAVRGGAVYSFDRVAFINQCTFVRNSAELGYSAAEIGGGTAPNIANCIFAYQNGRPAIRRPSNQYSLNSVHNCLFNANGSGSFYPGNAEFLDNLFTVNINGDSTDDLGNLYQDPAFVDTANGDFHLLTGSSAIDAGVAGLGFHTTNDPDGTPPDIGAFYFDQTSASDVLPELPSEISLSQNYPNPFNAETTIEFEVPIETRATLELFDITGRHVQTLFDGLARGTNSVHVSMNGMASGIYIYRLNASGYALSHKMLLIK